MLYIFYNFNDETKLVLGLRYVVRFSFLLALNNVSHIRLTFLMNFLESRLILTQLSRIIRSCRIKPFANRILKILIVVFSDPFEMILTEFIC